MEIGNLRNRDCPSCDKFPSQKYKKCCWDKDYWKGFMKIKNTQEDGTEKESWLKNPRFIIQNAA
jgi:hypothetical protein